MYGCIYMQVFHKHALIGKKDGFKLGLITLHHGTECCMNFDRFLKEYEILNNLPFRLNTVFTIVRQEAY